MSINQGQKKSSPHARVEPLKPKSCKRQCQSVNSAVSSEKRVLVLLFWSRSVTPQTAVCRSVKQSRMSHSIFSVCNVSMN